MLDRGIALKGVSPSETWRLADALPGLTEQRLRQAVLVIGYRYDRSYRRLVEPYLHHTETPAVAVEALATLA